jgi:phosphohistidine phosphatase
MKDLLLMRHAKAVGTSINYGDLGRPLNSRGRRAAAAVARDLQRRGARPSVILCSPSRRTRETLDLVLEALTPTPPILIEPELYLAGAEQLITRLRQLAPEVGSVLLIGHNEGLADAAVALATSGDAAALASMRAKFPTGAVAWLRAPIDAWSQLGQAGAALVAFVRPRDLADAA